MQRVAFMGLGVMGFGMAGQLLKAGHTVTVYNRTQERAAPLLAQGAELAAFPREAAQNADVIVAMVADDHASRQIWLGENGALRGARRGTVAVDCSTLSSAWVQELSQAAKQHGCEFLDAPVTGTRIHAETGELQFLVGGEATTLERIRPVLEVMSRDIVHFGPSGSGALMKLINNYAAGVQAACLAEALVLIERTNLNREAALALLTNGPTGSPLVRRLAPQMASRDYSLNFHLHLMQKDLNYALTEAKAHGLSFETGVGALNLFARACEKGWGLKDVSSVVEALR